MDYRDESTYFVNTAFRLLDEHKFDPHSREATDINTLQWPYGLRINDQGQLNLVKIVEIRPGFETAKIIGHTYGNKYSQITYIGKLLAIYLEHLQMDNE